MFLRLTNSLALSMSFDASLVESADVYSAALDAALLDDGDHDGDEAGHPADGDDVHSSVTGEDDGAAAADADAEAEAEEEEEEEEEEEPKLKYQRLGASVTEILKHDSCSCLAAHEKFIVRPPLPLPALGDRMSACRWILICAR